MTTIDAAAARHFRKSIALTVIAAFVGLGLSGCATGTNIFSSASDPAASTATADASGAIPAGQTAKFVVAPVIGAPDAVAKQLQAQLTSAIEKQKVTVAKTAADKAEFTLRGYVVSAREKSATKVSYIWDVTDPTGKRVNRITGEEVLAGGDSKDPWAAVSPQVVDMIANKTAGSLASWLPTQNQAAVATNATPTSAAATTPAPVQAAVATMPASGLAGSTPPATPVATTGPTTGSIEREGAMTMVPSVTGAPGDGSIALTGALQRELSRNGVALTDKAQGQTYRVEGKVVVGQGKDGKQPIQIDWNVKDPQGKKLGTVSQKNEIPQGSLDGAWGKTADAAAAAAAQGILKLLPPQTRTN